MKNNTPIISIASGKGGTGKTTIATNLAVAIARKGTAVAYIDCDVEEPNGYLFLKPEITEKSDVTVPVPLIDSEKCTLCGDCSASCEYHAIAVLGKTVTVFPSLCHGCGGCSDVCPENAIHEMPRTIGRITRGVGMGVSTLEGRLNVGEALSPPVTRALKKTALPAEVTIIDAPPGTSCPVIEAIGGTDFVILITEPTPFGLNDLKLAVGTVRELGLSFGVVINRSDIGDTKTDEFCRTSQIEVMLKIPFDRNFAETYSRGEMLVDVDSLYGEQMTTLYRRVIDRITA